MAQVWPMEKFAILGVLRRGRLSRLTRLRTVWWFNNLLFTRGMLLLIGFPPRQSIVRKIF